MKYFVFFCLFIFKLSFAKAEESIAFIDLNYIMNNSISGKSINNFINKQKKNKLNDFKIIENEIKKDENDLVSKKNVLENEIFEKKVKEIQTKIKNYNSSRKNFDNSLEKQKINYTNKLLEILNPIISNYVEKNSINMVLPKKMIVIGKKKLDITIPILKELDTSIQKFSFDE